MDDFGSGYSSLNVLKDIPVDELKLDRVFLSSAKDEARRDTIVRHVIRLAEDLGITTVSEGVETDEQVAFLRACGCDIAQGFYFAKPMPPEELENRLLTTRSGAGAADVSRRGSGSVSSERVGRRSAGISLCQAGCLCCCGRGLIPPVEKRTD